MWLPYTLIGIVFFSIYYILARFFLRDKRGDPISYAIVFNTISALLVFLAAFSQGFELPPLDVNALNLVLLAFLYTGSQIFTFKASKAIEASELIILSSTRALWTIGAAVMFLGESFDVRKALGTALILFSVWLVSDMKKGVTLGKGQIYTLLAALLLGLGFVNDSYILQTSDALSFGAIAFIIPAITTALIFPSATKKLTHYLDVTTLGKILLLSMSYSTGMIFLFVAYQSGGDASQIMPVGQSIVVVTILLSALFLGERKNLFKKILAGIIVGIGVVLLS